MLKPASWCSMVAMALASFAATAQDAPAPDARKGEPATATQLDRIVVTARRRDEALQQVPMSVTALDAVELETRGAQDLGDVDAAVPNVMIYAARPFNNAITAYIRGVGQSEPVWGVDPGVAVYLDDVYLARPQAALLDILDVDRIEVLRGPQGTLYGKNTIGGAIKYVTRDIGDTFSGDAAITVGDYARHDFKAALTLPLGERLRTRVTVGSFDRSGFGENLVTGAEVGAKHARVARVAAGAIARRIVPGMTVRGALGNFIRTGEPYSGPTDEYSAGNGSIMRLAPVPLFYAHDPKAAIAYARDSSRIPPYNLFANLQDVATEAGVSVESIYKWFGSKAGLLRGVWERSLAGSEPTHAEQRSDAGSRAAADGAAPAVATVVPFAELTRTPSARPRSTRSVTARCPTGPGAPDQARPAASAVARARSQ